MSLSSLEEVKYVDANTWGYSRLHKASMRADVESIRALKTHTTVPLFTSVTYLAHLFACLNLIQHLEWLNVITKEEVLVCFFKVEWTEMWCFCRLELHEEIRPGSRCEAGPVREMRDCYREGIASHTNLHPQLPTPSSCVTQVNTAAPTLHSALQPVHSHIHVLQRRLPRT